MEQLGSSIETHRRIGLEHQRPIVQLERIIRIFEALIDLVQRVCESGSVCTTVRTRRAGLHIQKLFCSNRRFGL